MVYVGVIQPLCNFLQQDCKEQEIKHIYMNKVCCFLKLMIVIRQKDCNQSYFLHSIFISITFFKQYGSNYIKTSKIIINRRFMLPNDTYDPGHLFHLVSRSSLEGVSLLKGGISTCSTRRSVLQVSTVTRGTGLS